MRGPAIVILSALSLVTGIQILPGRPDTQVPILKDSSLLMPDQGPLLADAISTERNINVFAGLTRDVESVTTRFKSSSSNTTVLAPVNSAIAKLPHKPWEDSEDYSAFGVNAYEGQDGSGRAQKNLERFVERHVVPESPWEEGVKVRTLEGKTVWYEKKDGKQLIQPDGIEVESVANKVSNGEVWILQSGIVGPKEQ
ncbi:MAG: hypothetical protein M1828_005369 [Chrysothrix sp. TS-e1954]|nr:MAG: hypothetical protein M1828_005369 [Chrysothrix sp. TS-e1954]